ncbi:SGNH/GDSL hydrolase family protein [Salinibacterium sp. ZJ450]|uniref:SGNH/GDSL hydrolase family protein n=1 Tax=Salinibacterium sp. ZJ450 TaxID=2708338 RepID=UPI001421D5C7|nr:SGNH/GDSL hydrolase family protein [Salinibacterium sp. ZJ450]
MGESAVFRSYVAIGDSFTEGVGDELPDGRVRGWADMVAAGLAAASEEPVSYANLAIRGRLLGRIISEQLEPALALKPELLSFNGGGNDMMRPRMSLEYLVALTRHVLDRAADTGTHVLLLSGANPSLHLPLGAVMQRRGDELAVALKPVIAGRKAVTMVHNWSDPELMKRDYWSADRLHLNATGHARVARNVLTALGVDWHPPVDESVAERIGTATYYRQYVLPWIGRRLTRKSSGDGREPKFAELTPVERPRL